jgi:CPA1 family monovalent cation:H+ antiporter
MREYLEQLLFVLAIGSAVAIGAKRISVPYNVALVVVGLLLVLMNVLPETPMDPRVVLLVFLPILVFQGALSADDTSMRRAARPILALAMPGVALSLISTAAIAAWEIGLPFSIALLLGAVLAITDTVSVLLAFRSVRVPHRLAAIMEGESLFNDGTALVLVTVAATVVMTGSADPVQIARMLVIAMAAGALLGIAFGTLGALVLGRAPDDLTAILASIVAVFATSLLTEHLGGSAVIAVVFAGVLIGHEMRARLEPSRVLALQGFWDVAAFILNVWLFLLVGMQLRSDFLLREAWPILFAVIALHTGRAVAVYGCFGALHLSGVKVPLRWQHVMVFGNVKGALSMAAVLSLPENVPYRDRLIAIVFGVTLVTLVVQALPFKRFLTWLGVAGGGGDELADECRAVLIGARRAQTELDTLLGSGLISRRDHAEQWAAFQRDIIEAERQLRHAAQDSHAHVALPAVLAARKAAILDAVRRGLITERTAGNHVAALDEQIVRAAAREHDDLKDE